MSLRYTTYAPGDQKTPLRVAGVDLCSHICGVLPIYLVQSPLFLLDMRTLAANQFPRREETSVLVVREKHEPCAITPRGFFGAPRDDSKN